MLNYINKKDYIVIDNLDNETMGAIESINNPIFLDCGFTKCFKNKSIIEMKKIFNRNYKIANFNERVITYLKNNYNLTCIDIYNMIQPELMIITRGKRGSTLIYNGIIQEKIIETPTKEIDSSGAGDAFFSEFIREYLNNSCRISERMINNAYKKASLLSSKVVGMLGARSHLQRLYKLESHDNCICDSKIIVKR